MKVGELTKMEVIKNFLKRETYFLGSLKLPIIAK
jgi:hypothetical protein